MLDAGRIASKAGDLQAESGSISLSGAQLSMLLEGIDWRRPERTWQPRAAA